MERSIKALLVAIFAALAHPAGAQVSYTANEISEHTWEYEYSIKNDLAQSLNEVTIFFDEGKFSNLQVQLSPAGWDSIVIQPDSALSADGFFDSLIFGTGLAPGASASGFKVRTDFFGAGVPASQLYNFVDSQTFAVLSSGNTVLSGASGPVNAPEIDTSSMTSAISLLAVSVVLLKAGKRRKMHCGNNCS